MAEPCIGTPRIADNLGAAVSVIQWRRDLHCRHLQVAHLSSHALGLTNFEDVKTLPECNEASNCRRLIGARERHLQLCFGRLEAAGLSCLDHTISLDFAGIS